MWRHARLTHLGPRELSVLHQCQVAVEVAVTAARPWQQQHRLNHVPLQTPIAYVRVNKRQTDRGL
jgi:hypothetical protein